MNLRIPYSLSLVLCLLLMQACTSQPAPVGIAVFNESTYNRQGEMVSVPADELLSRLQLNDTAQFLILDPQGESVPYQLTYDGNFIFRADVNARSKAVYTVQEGSPLPFDRSVESSVVGRQHPVMAWANDFMVYVTPQAPQSPTTDSRGGGSYILPDKTAITALGEEIDNESDYGGPAADSVSGQALPIEELIKKLLTTPVIDCGGTALVGPDSLISTKGWTEYEILDNGPLRLTIRLLDAPIKSGTQTLTCTRTITLDADCPLNHICLHFDSIGQPLKLATRIALRSAAATALAETGTGILAAADTTVFVPGRKTVTYMGCAFPVLPVKTGIQRFPSPSKGIGGYATAYSECCPRTDVCYYAGAVRNKRKFPSWQSWTDYLARFIQEKRVPLRVVLE